MQICVNRFHNRCNLVTKGRLIWPLINLVWVFSQPCRWNCTQCQCIIIGLPTSDCVTWYFCFFPIISLALSLSSGGCFGLEYIKLQLGIISAFTFFSFRLPEIMFCFYLEELQWWPFLFLMCSITARCRQFVKLNGKLGQESNYFIEYDLIWWFDLWHDLVCSNEDVLDLKYLLK